MTLFSSRSLLERYRCPDQYALFDAQQSVQMSRGRFQFGRDLLCYGNCASSLLNGDLRDAPSGNFSEARLVFNPDEIVENLRRERYAAFTNPAGTKLNLLRAVRAAYYALRPIIPAQLRSQAKRVYLIAGKWESTKFPQWPVDTTADLLLERLLELSLYSRDNVPIPFIWFWPDGYDSCAMMTHDVETRAGRDFISPLIKIDTASAIKASFQIIPEKRYAVDETLLQEIREHGFEVNLHDLNHDGRLFDDREEFLRRAEKINRYLREYAVQGFRSGAMYRKQDWYGAFEFEYDMSVPNVAHLDPQPGGCCTVMPYFIDKILEIPLTTAQDYSLFYLLKERSIDLWKRQIDVIQHKQGLISFIVHPDYILDASHRRMYEELLEYLKRLQESGTVWFALPGNVNRWWRQRSKMRLSPSQGSWRIDGDGCERARVAYAQMQDGKLTYRVESPETIVTCQPVRTQSDAVHYM